MIATILQISWISLRRDRVALLLTFLLPIAFFSVFALVFGGIDEGVHRSVRAALVADSSSPMSRRWRDVLMNSRSLQLITADTLGDPLTRAQAMQLLERNRVDVAILIPPDSDLRLTAFIDQAPEIALYVNSANPMAQPIAEGVLQSAAVQLALESIPHRSSVGEPYPADGLVRVRVERTLERSGKRPSISYFAAGIGVMFLLFAVSGRSAVLIEERESGVLTRLRSSQLTLTQLLAGRWLFLSLVGFVQVTIMFAWAALAFGLELWTARHLFGFLVMTATSAAAAAALGLFLATVCRSRAQLNGIASVLILVMSAIGGSMFPRFLMPEGLQTLGLLTFNAWAVSGYQKIFWYEAHPARLVPEIAVLVLAAVLLGVSARIVAGRWLTA